MPSVLFTDDIKSEVAVEKSDAISAQRERRLNHGPFSAARRTSFHCSSFVLTVWAWAPLGAWRDLAGTPESFVTAAFLLSLRLRHERVCHDQLYEVSLLWHLWVWVTQLREKCKINIWHVLETGCPQGGPISLSRGRKLEAEIEMNFNQFFPRLDLEMCPVDVVPATSCRGCPWDFPSSEQTA